jgi:beta-lactamase regulating signal transducer with metallopeptidase domain
MTAVVQLSEFPPVHALGWTLLHFCWQGAVAAIMLACALGLIPLRASRLRYFVACAAMVFMVVLPAITFCVLETETPLKPQRFAVTVAAEDFGRTLNRLIDPSAGLWTVRFERVLNQRLPAVIVFWFAGVLLLLCRLNLGLMATRKMKSLAGESTSAEIQDVLRALRIRLGIQRSVKLLNSARVQAPIVIGWLKPAILISVGCMAGLSTLQIEAILAHELAHIRRHDYLVNLFQSVIETVLFYHPAVWWVSKQIRREREHCCDDLAVAVCGDRLAYAKALSFLEERRTPVPAGAFGAAGGVLTMRIARLLGLNRPPTFSHTAAAILLALAATTAGLTVWGSAHAQLAPSQKRATSPADTPVQVRSLTIDSNDLPESERVEIVQEFQGSTYPLEELVERIRRNVQDRGHVKASVELLQPASSAAAQPLQPMNVSVRISAGAVYTVSGFSIEGAHVFTQDEIIRQFPLHPGDLFSATAMGKGFDRIRELYESKGYINFALVPQMRMDDARHTLIMIIDIDEGKPSAA